MSRKDTVNSLFSGKLGAPNPNSSPVRDKDRVRTGAISAMGSSLQHLTDGARSAARLEEQLATGSTVIEIDPTEIDTSMVRDRLVADIDPSFDALVNSIELSGQQVPILVRPHPEREGRYQVAYGHRRLRAAAKLGRHIKAIVKALTDSELVIAQGKENLDRKDLSFIEKALFARRLEDAGFERATIISALSTDKSDLSRYLAVSRIIPDQLMEKIGPAQKAGRSRWIAFSKRLKGEGATDIIRRVTEDDKFQAVDSDRRFTMLFEALDGVSHNPERRVEEWKGPNGEKSATIEYRTDRTTVTVDEKQLPKFGAFLAAKLGELYQEFLKLSDQKEEK